MRWLAFLMSLGCAHNSADQPIRVTEPLRAELKIAFPEASEARYDDDDCDAHAKAEVEASFVDLRNEMVKHGFTLVEAPSANLFLSEQHHVTTCTYDGMVKGSSTVILQDAEGQTVEQVSLFPLWPEGLVRQLLASERLAAFAQNPDKPKPKATQPERRSGSFVLLPMKTELEAALADKLTQYLALRVAESGLVQAEESQLQLSSQLMQLGSKCVLSAKLGDRAASERTTCDPDALAAAVERIAKKLVE